MNHSGDHGGGGGGVYKGEGRDGGRVEGQKDSNNNSMKHWGSFQWRQKGEGGFMVPKSSDNSIGVASIISCLGRALSAM